MFKVSNAKTLDTMAKTVTGNAMIGLEYLLRRRGTMSMSPPQLGAFTRSDPQQRSGDITSGNTNSPTSIIAKRAAAMIIQGA